MTVMTVYCGSCGTLTRVADGYRHCDTCRTKTKLKQTAKPRRTGGINHCCECSTPIPYKRTHCTRCE